MYPDGLYAKYLFPCLHDLVFQAVAGCHALLTSTGRWARAGAAAVLVLITFEYLPIRFPTTAPPVPAYVEELRRLPDGAVLDLASNASVTLYYQTLHQKPQAFGYISRTPTSVGERDAALAALIRAGEWEQIARDYGFRYIVKGQRSALRLATVEKRRSIRN